MIRHTILFKVKANIPDHEIERIVDIIRSYERNISGVFTIVSGECQFHSEKCANYFMKNLPNGASHSISIDFFDQNALNEFYKNPTLLNAKNEIVSIAEDGYEGIVSFDMDVVFK